MSKQLERVGIQTKKDLYLRIVAPRNLFIEFVHEVRSATRLPFMVGRESGIELSWFPGRILAEIKAMPYRLD